MTSNFDFTDKAQLSLTAAAQLAKDYANAQVHPAHIAFALLNEDPSLFSSVIQKAGGDTVCSFNPINYLIMLILFLQDNSQARSSKTHRPHTLPISSTR